MVDDVMRRGTALPHGFTLFTRVTTGQGRVGRACAQSLHSIRLLGARSSQACDRLTRGVRWEHLELDAPLTVEPSVVGRAGRGTGSSALASGRGRGGALVRLERLCIDRTILSYKP